MSFSIVCPVPSDPAPSLLSSSAEGKHPMGNLSVVVRQLRTERERAQTQVHRIDAALAALGSLSSNGASYHSMSAAVRRKMSLAQKARWAKRTAKQAGKMKPKRTMSASARRKIAAAQRKRWAKVKAQQKKAA